MATSEGVKALSFFKNFPKTVKNRDPDGSIRNFIDKLLLKPLAHDFFPFDQPIENINYQDFNEFSDDITNRIEQVVINYDLEYRDLVEGIPNLSIILYAESQQFAFPYLYPVQKLSS